jgi:hypothetical protein
MYIVYGLFANGDIFYIGKTTEDRLVKRLVEHRCRAKKHDNQKIYNKIRKLIKEQIPIEIRIMFQGNTEDDQTKKEIELITQYGIKSRLGGVLYNSTNGGEGITGWSHTDEAKKKMSEAKIGNKINVGRNRPDMVERFSKPIFVYDLAGKFVAEFTSAREAEPAIGVSYKRISAALDCRKAAKTLSDSTGIWYRIRSEKTTNIDPYKFVHSRSVMVVQYTKKMEQIAKYENSVRACETTGISDICIRNACQGKQKTAGGFIWQYHQ